MSTSSFDGELDLYTRGILTGDDSDENNTRNFQLPKRIDLGICTVSRLKVEKFLTFVLTTCLVFLILKAIERMKVFDKPQVLPDLMAGFVMIFLLHDLFRLPGHENEDEAPTG